jgi:glutathione S-transferase
MSRALVCGGFVVAGVALTWLFSSRAKRHQKLKLGYWKIRGLAAAIRYALEFRSVPYEDVFYEQGDDLDRSSWLNVKQTLPSPFPNLPYLVDPSLGDRVLVESKAILQHLGRTLDLYGRTEREHSVVDMVIYALEDVRKAFTTLSYSRDFAALREEFCNTIPAKFAPLEAHLKARHADGQIWVASR